MAARHNLEPTEYHQVPVYKMLLIGDSNAGKAQLLARYCRADSLNQTFVTTIGVDFYIKEVQRGDKTIKLQIWDTAGQERFRTITTSYYRGAMGIVLVFDVTSEDSFENITTWLQEIKRYASTATQVILVGNKCHLAEHRMITKEQAQELAQSQGLEYFETSTEHNINVSEIFERLTDKITESIGDTKEPEDTKIGSKRMHESSNKRGLADGLSNEKHSCQLQ